MAFVEARNIRRSFPGVVALDGVDLRIEAGSVHVLAGENGAGKSTLVRILTGTEAPESGELLIDGHDALIDRTQFGKIAFVPQELNLFRHLSVAENLLMPFRRTGFGSVVLSRRRMHAAASEHLARFAIRARPEQKVSEISVSDQQLLQIARAATVWGFRMLILDEPTSSLTGNETERLFRIIRQLRDSGHAVIFISHKMDEITALGDEVTVLRNGRVVGHSALNRITVPKLIQLMSGEEVRLDETFKPRVAAGEPLLAVHRLGGRGFRDVSFELRRGEILGFAGLVGAGRTELMQTIFGMLGASGGTVTLEGAPLALGSPSASVRRGLLYLSEERKLHGILPRRSVRENIGISVMRQTAPRGVISSIDERRLVAEVIERYGIRTASLETRIMFLSGGNQQKTIIGRAMAQAPRVLIFDEPTKGIDVRTKAEIYRLMQALAEKGIGIVLVSSEMEELRRCASRIITMYQGAISGEFINDETDRDTLVAAIIGQAPGQHAA